MEVWAESLGTKAAAGVSAAAEWDGSVGLPVGIGLDKGVNVAGVDGLVAVEVGRGLVVLEVVEELNDVQRVHDTVTVGVGEGG